MKSKLRHAATLFWFTLFAACFVAMLVNNSGCHMIAGIGRDLTAAADGMSSDSAASARAIRQAQAASDSH